MTDAQKRYAQRQRTLKKWFDSLPPEKQVPLTDAEMAGLVADGVADENGLTEKGRLKLHQLELLEWMVNSPRYKKKEADAGP